MTPEELAETIDGANVNYAPDISCDDWQAMAKALLAHINQQAAEVERLRSVISEPVKSFGTMELVSWVNRLQKTISEYPDAEWGNWPFVLMMGVRCENFSKRWHSPTIELMAARIKELEAEVEAKQANNEYLQKMTEEAQGIMQESQLLLCKEANEAEQLQNEVERLRSENNDCLHERVKWFNYSLSRQLTICSQKEEIATKDVRIKRLEASLENAEALVRKNASAMNGYLARIKELQAEIERIDAAFLEATKEIVYATHEGRDAPEGEDAYAEKVARDALEKIKAGGTDESI